MLKRVRLWWLELRLESQLGKYHAYLNRVHDTNVTDADEKLAIAADVLRSPSLNKGERWTEYQRVVDRQEQLLREPVVVAKLSSPTRGLRLIARLRTLVHKVRFKSGKDVVVHANKKAPLSGK